MVAARSCEYTCAWKVIRFTHMRQLHKPRLHFFTAPRKLLHHLPRLEPAYTVPVRLVSNLLAHGFSFFGAPPASDNGCLLFALLCTVLLPVRLTFLVVVLSLPLSMLATHQLFWVRHSVLIFCTRRWSTLLLTSLPSPIDPVTAVF